MSHALRTPLTGLRGEIEALVDGVHADLRDVSDRAINSLVKNLRRKIAAADPGCDCIASVYSVGYQFDPPDR